MYHWLIQMTEHPTSICILLLIAFSCWCLMFAALHIQMYKWPIPVSCRPINWFYKMTISNSYNRRRKYNFIAPLTHLNLPRPHQDKIYEWIVPKHSNHPEKITRLQSTTILLFEFDLIVCIKISIEFWPIDI